jgi:hypothetical protein
MSHHEHPRAFGGAASGCHLLRAPVYSHSLAESFYFRARMAEEQSLALCEVATSWDWCISVEQAPGYGRISWLVRGIRFRVRSWSTFCFNPKPQRSIAPFPSTLWFDRLVFFMGNCLRVSSLGPDSRSRWPARFDSEMFSPVCVCGYRDRSANFIGVDSRSRDEIPVRHGYRGLDCRLSALSF